MSFKYIKSQQRKWEKKWRREDELEAIEEARRVAKMEAEAHEREEAAYRKRQLLEQQENERLLKKRLESEKIVAENKWDNQCDMLVAQIKDRLREDNKLEEIRFIVHNRDPSLQMLDWADWLSSDPLNQRLADLDIEHAMEMFKRDNLMAARRSRTRGKKAGNYALTFAADDDYVSTAFDPNEFKLYNGFTVSFWVKPDGWGQKYALGLKHDSSPQYHFAFGIKTAIKGWAGVGGDVNSGWSHGMEKGNWYHYVVTYNGDDDLIEDSDGLGGNKDLKVYINGVEKFDGNADWPVNKRTVGQEKVFIGARNNDGYGGGWNCSIDEVAIFDTEKDADWITSVYDGGTGYSHEGKSNLVGYWKFNEGRGTTVEDLSGNGNHGTLTTEGAGIPTWGTVPGGYDQ
jgi:hypothetical protein